jgi:hypothetical protein
VEDLLSRLQYVICAKEGRAPYTCTKLVKILLVFIIELRKDTALYLPFQNEGILTYIPGQLDHRLSQDGRQCTLYLSVNIVGSASEIAEIHWTSTDPQYYFCDRAGYVGTEKEVASTSALNMLH